MEATAARTGPAWGIHPSVPSALGERIDFTDAHAVLEERVSDLAGALNVVAED